MRSPAAVTVQYLVVCGTVELAVQYVTLIMVETAAQDETYMANLGIRGSGDGQNNYHCSL